MSLLADIDSLPRHPATPVLTPLEILKRELSVHTTRCGKVAAAAA
ncbi:MAG TPA: hypothetical protein VIQ76_10430 [Propionibacteriaceae bacterium]|jgi:hypothetical protein